MKRDHPPVVLAFSELLLFNALLLELYQVERGGDQRDDFSPWRIVYGAGKK